MDQGEMPPADVLRRMLQAHRRGEQARAALAGVLDPHALYSELPDPPTVFMVIRGELVEVKPVSLFPPAPAARPPGGTEP